MLSASPEALLTPTCPSPGWLWAVEEEEVHELLKQKTVSVQKLDYAPLPRIPQQLRQRVCMMSSTPPPFCRSIDSQGLSVVSQRRRLSDR